MHHTHLLGNSILDHLKKNDIVFFDDCLFSQYVFLKQNQSFFKSMSIDCVLGFSSGLYASEDAEQTYAIESHVLHDACNKCIKTLEDADKLRLSLLEMDGFMKVSQVKELLLLPFCYLALHGCCHLKLEDEKGLLNKLYAFKRDLRDGVDQLKCFGLNTQMYVYPYVYSFCTSDKMLNSAGFNVVVGSKAFRLAIEDIAQKNGQAVCNC